jgi:hypothetical protein
MSFVRKEKNGTSIMRLTPPTLEKQHMSCVGQRGTTRESQAEAGSQRHVHVVSSLHGPAVLPCARQTPGAAA